MPGHKRPKGKIDPYVVLLGLIAFGCMASEGTMYDWSAVYYEAIIKPSPELIRLGYIAYMCTMVCGRFMADGLVTRFGVIRILQASGALIAAGLLISVLLPHVATATFGLALVGFGHGFGGAGLLQHGREIPDHASERGAGRGFNHRVPRLPALPAGHRLHRPRVEPPPFLCPHCRVRAHDRCAGAVPAAELNRPAFPVKGNAPLERRCCSLFQTAAFPTKEPFSHPLEERALFAGQCPEKGYGLPESLHYGRTLLTPWGVPAGTPDLPALPRNRACRVRAKGFRRTRPAVPPSFDPLRSGRMAADNRTDDGTHLRICTGPRPGRLLRQGGASSAQTRASGRRLGFNENAVWGECKGSGSKPYQVEADLSGPVFKCTCPEPEISLQAFPGLLLLRVQQEAAFTQGEAPIG